MSAGNTPLTFNRDQGQRIPLLTQVLANIKRSRSGLLSTLLSFAFTLFTPVSYAMPIVSFPYSESFESGPADWTTPDGTLWELGTPVNTFIIGASDGVNAWITDLDADYTNDAFEAVVSPVFDFSGFNQDPIIAMDVWWNSEFSWDGAVLQSSIDGGANWIRVGANGEPDNWFNDDTINSLTNNLQTGHGWTGANNTVAYVRASHTLTGLGGQAAVQLRVLFASDGSIAGNGFAFDNVFIAHHVTSTIPASNAQTIAANSTITLNFGGVVSAVDATAQNIVVSSAENGLVSGVFSGGGSNSIVFTPAASFESGDRITVTVTAAVASPYVFQFRIASALVLIPTTVERVVSTTADGARSVHVGDVDGDGDLDILSASLNDDTIAWYENDGAVNPSFTERLVSTVADGAISVHVGDVDGDGDLDILSASSSDDTIAWYENNGAANPSFTKRVVSTMADIAQSVHVGDVDGDGDLDILSASFGDHKIAWYENDGAVDPTFTERVVSALANGARSVHVGDVDGDGDLDILSASSSDDKIAWYENNGAVDPTFTERVVSITADFAFSVHVGDVDGDGDLDILSASANDDKIAWYESDGAVVPTFTERVVSTTADFAFSVHVGDVDGDGDLDILSASLNDDTIAWYENDGAAVPTFTERVVSTTADGVSVHVGDVDGDGDLDILSASLNDDTIAWYEVKPGVNIISTVPTSNAQTIAANSTITLNFDAVVAAVDLTAQNIVVSSAENGLVPGVFSGGGTSSIVFTPAASFESGDRITVTVTRDVASSMTVFQFRIASALVLIPTTVERVVSTMADSASSVHVGDVDGDGDLDILSASSGDDTIAWYENNAVINPSFTKRVVSTSADFAFSVNVGDVDGDGDLDILSASVNDNKIAWYENDGAVDPTFTERVVSTAADNALSVHVGDVDGDGDLDILSASENDDKIAWYENDGAVDPTFTERVVSTTANGASSVHVGDVDGDGDLDILSASSFGDKIAWYENDGAVDPTFTERVVSTTADGAFSVHVGDVDGDGDLDILSASENDDKIAWYENNGAVNPMFTEQVVSTTAFGAVSVQFGDVDGDGDLDILSASFFGDKIAWYENDGAAIPLFAERVVSTTADGVFSVHVGDVDGDGDLDILSASTIDDKIAWYEVFTDATKDSDGDTITDLYEVQNGLDVNVNDASGDLDGDGLTNLEEFNLGLKANDPDTDGDGIDDGLDPEPLITSNDCTGADATFMAVVAFDISCAAMNSITVDQTIINSSGSLLLISPTVIFNPGFNAAGELRVISEDPCPSCPL